jgi:hypothetical protein
VPFENREFGDLCSILIANEERAGILKAKARCLNHLAFGRVVSVGIPGIPETRHFREFESDGLVPVGGSLGIEEA